MSRLRRLSIQSRTVAGATLALAVALLLGGLILRSQLRHSLSASIAADTVTRAQGVASLVATGDFTQLLDSPGPSPSWIQVVDPQGNILASTANVRTLRKAFAPIPTDGLASVSRRSGLAIDTGERVVVATVPVAGGKRDLIVLAASPLDIADASDRRAILSLLLVFPALLLIGALTVWLVVRKALQPVEAIRREVATISSSDLAQRVPRPNTNDEIDRLAATMNDMLDRLQTSITRQRRFVGDASHELRSPLASLRNQLEVSTIDNPDPVWAQTVTDMITDHDRLERLINDLLLLARHDDAAEVASEPVDLGYLVRVEMARRPPAIGMERSVVAQNALVAGSSDSFARILRNLVDNAERHAHSYVHIRLDTITDSGRDIVQLEVEDDGPGIPKSKRAMIFERFNRLDDARASDVGGSGLGLAIVAELVKAHHGTVSAQAGAIGALFIVRFPPLTVD